MSATSRGRDGDVSLSSSPPEGLDGLPGATVSCQTGGVGASFHYLLGLDASPHDAVGAHRHAKLLKEKVDVRTALGFPALAEEEHD